MLGKFLKNSQEICCIILIAYFKSNNLTYVHPVFTISSFCIIKIWVDTFESLWFHVVVRVILVCQCVQLYLKLSFSLFSTP